MHAAGELRPRRRKDHEARGCAVGYAVDEAQDQRVSPMEVLDPDDDRSPSREGGEVTLPRTGEHLALLQTWKRDDTWIHGHADAVRDGRGNCLDIVRVGHQCLHALLDRCRGGIEDVRGDELAEWRLGAVLLAGPAPCLEDRRRRAEGRDHLARQPALPLTGRTDDESEPGLSGADAAVCGIQQIELALASRTSGQAMISSKPFGLSRCDGPNSATYSVELWQFGPTRICPGSASD